MVLNESVVPTSGGKADLLYVVYQLECQSLPDSPRNVSPAIGASFNPVKFTPSVNHHGPFCIF